MKKNLYTITVKVSRKEKKGIKHFNKAIKHLLIAFDNVSPEQRLYMVKCINEIEFEKEGVFKKD